MMVGLSAGLPAEGTLHSSPQVSAETVAGHESYHQFSEREGAADGIAPEKGTGGEGEGRRGERSNGRRKREHASRGARFGRKQRGR